MPTATLEHPLPTPVPASDGLTTDPSASPPAAPATAAPATAARARHLPRRTRTATSRLRAIDTRALALGPQMFDRSNEGGSGAAPGTALAISERAEGRSAPSGRFEQADADHSRRSEHAVRSLSLRELVTGAGTAAGAWTLAAHLGLLGTAGGVFLISLVSTTGVALVADSLTGARRMLMRLLGGARQRRTHRRRIERMSAPGGRELTPPS